MTGYRRSWVEQHPTPGVEGDTRAGRYGRLLTTAPYRWCPVLSGIGYAAYLWGVRSDHKQQLRREIAAHADYEHHLWMQGDPRGTYGRYPPVL
jgi:hypothetical protein